MLRPAPFRVLFHPDSLRLVQELVARVRDLRPPGAPSCDPILVLAPTRRQVLFLREALAREFPALLGLEVLHHQALAYRMARTGERPAPAVASRALLENLVQHVLAGLPDHPVSRYVEEHPSVLSALVSTVKELREAGVTPVDLAAAGSNLAPVLSGYESALFALERDMGLCDRAGLARRAVEAAAHHPPLRAVFHYGAYELVTMNLDLLRALSVEEPIVFLLPGDLEAPSGAYARRFVEMHLASGDGFEVRALPPEGAAERSHVTLAAGVRRLGPRPVVPPGTLRRIEAPGPEAELQVAARETLRLLAAGTPPQEIAVVARTLEPYAVLAEMVFAAHGLPVDSSAKLPLSRYARPRAFLLLLRALAGDFPRQDVVDLLRSPGLRVPEWARGDEALWQPDAWDRWSRTYGILGGAEAWIRDLPETIASREKPEWVAEEPEASQRYEEQHARDVVSARTLARLVEEWNEERERARTGRTAAAHAAFLRALAARWIWDWDGGRRREGEMSGPITSALGAVLQDLAGLDGVARAARPASGFELTFAQAAAFVESAIEEASLPWTREPGVAFLDVMQARGLAFRHVFWIGFNDSLVPRHPRESPLLPDRVRARLSRPGRPLAVRLDTLEEEWLLAVETVAAATESLTLVWARADAEGKARIVSFLDRELPEGSVERIPTHPAFAADWLEAHTGLITAEEAALVAAERDRRDPGAAVRRVLTRVAPERLPRLTPGLVMIDALEAFSGRNLGYDGLLPRGYALPRPFSASNLQRMAECPQTFFFQDVLGVRPLDEEAEEIRYEAFRLGTLVHRLLELIFEDLDREGLLDGRRDAPTLVAAARRILERRWRDALAPVAGRMAPRFPLLFAGLERAWRGEIDVFLAADLQRFAERGWRLEAVERAWVEDIPLPAGARLLQAFDAEALPGDGLSARVRGIPDRVVVDATGRRTVSDYKTQGKPEEWLEPENLLTGRKLQAPLYALLARLRHGSPDVESEFLALGPSFLPDRGFARTGPVTLTAGDLDANRPPLEETLAVLISFVARGRFPFNPDGPCRYCAFARACRRQHFPSRARIQGDPRYEAYFLAAAKKKSWPTLAQVAAHRSGNGEDA